MYSLFVCVFDNWNIHLLKNKKKRVYRHQLTVSKETGLANYSYGNPAYLARLEYVYATK